MHSTDPAKDRHAFAKAFATHRERNGDNFAWFVFPEEVRLGGITFPKGASFYQATFTMGADFSGAAFDGSVSFLDATFTESAYFVDVIFKEVDFSEAVFAKDAVFYIAKFAEKANFFRTTFKGQADFTETSFTEINFFEATFVDEVDFSRASFTKSASFFRASFSGKALFAGIPRGFFTESPEATYIFTGTEIDFAEVAINTPDAVTFLGADLTKCRFLDSDLRKVQLVDVIWPRKGRRVIVHDEMLLVKSAKGNVRLRSQIERLYRQLKQNYEDRRDYERAGDFHYGEKEMRRKNPETAWGLRLFLTLYCWFSGYGERYLRPLLCAGGLLLLSTIGYMGWGLRPKDGGAPLAWVNVGDWLQAAHYSFRVMTLLKPDDWVPLRYAQVVNTFQTLLGPVFLGLFALALRQRLKR